MYDKIFYADMKLCGFFNRACHYNMVQQFFAVISRLGNGIFWYLLMIYLLIVYGWPATVVVTQMLISALVGLLIYKVIKNNTERLRPYMVSDSIKLGTKPLDQFSFPSGHTLHAISFSLIVCFYYPGFTMFLLPVTILVAASRVILGLHYPSDVLMGALIGLITSVSIVFIFN